MLFRRPELASLSQELGSLVPLLRTEERPRIDSSLVFEPTLWKLKASIFSALFSPDYLLNLFLCSPESTADKSRRIEPINVQSPSQKPAKASTFPANQISPSPPPGDAVGHVGVPSDGGGGGDGAPARRPPLPLRLVPTTSHRPLPRGARRLRSGEGGDGLASLMFHSSFKTLTREYFDDRLASCFCPSPLLVQNFLIDWT